MFRDDETDSTGTFSIQAQPQPALELGAAADAGRMRFDKTFSGALQGQSVVQMMSAGNPASGSAAYVAIEYFNGSLDGHAGSFMTWHCGAMDDGNASLTIGIVPGSGTGALEGIQGGMDIDIQDGVHHYAIAYDLPQAG